MSDNILQTLQQLAQDVIAPDVRELKVRMDSLGKQVDSLDKHIDQRFNAMDQKFEAQLKATDQKFEIQLRAMDQKFEAQFKNINDRFKSDDRFKSIDDKFKAMDQKSDAQLKLILAAHRRIQGPLLATLSEPVAVLESQRHEHFEGEPQNARLRTRRHAPHRQW